MDSLKIARPWIAMSAAYALALQMLLTVAVAAQHAASAASGAGLCITSATGDPALPAEQPPCSVCVLAASDSGPGLVAVAEPQREYGAAATPVSIPVASLLAPDSPRLSQGPPRIA